MTNQERGGTVPDFSHQHEHEEEEFELDHHTAVKSPQPEHHGHTTAVDSKFLGTAPTTDKTTTPRSGGASKGKKEGKGKHKASSPKDVIANIKQYDPQIEEASKQFGVPVEQIRAIIAQESRGNPNASSGVAFGLMQVTKGTWETTIKHHKALASLGFESWADPRINILVGTAALTDKMKTVDVSKDDPNYMKLAITAYNAGEQTVKLAIRYARQDGSTQPTSDCLKESYLAKAIEDTKIYSYYLPGHKGANRNKSGSVAEAIHLKFLEVSKYPGGVQSYLDAQSGDANASTSTQKEQVQSPPNARPSTTSTASAAHGDKSPQAEPHEKHSQGSDPAKHGTAGEDTPSARVKGIALDAAVGEGGENNSSDVEKVQRRLSARGLSPGPADGKIGRHTLDAIRRFQRALMKHPDGLIEPGKLTEQHLFQDHGKIEMPEETAQNPKPAAGTRAHTESSASPGKQAEEQPAHHEDGKHAETGEHGAQQMSSLLAHATNSGAPLGHCYTAVKHYIIAAGGYGNIRDPYKDKRLASAQGEAHMFADTVNVDPGSFGLDRLSMDTPFAAPAGAIVVVKHGSPGTHHPTAGDITVAKGDGFTFYNDGVMHYRGPAAWNKPHKGGVLGVYRPK